MANFTAKDAAGATQEFATTSGDGSNGSPFVVARGVADGSDVNAGATTDAAATAGGTGTVAAKLRALSRDTGALTETAPATDTASSGLNGRLQRIAQRLTSLIALLPTALGQTTASASLPVTLATDGQFVTSTGSLTETAPATDTASSGLNGRLQRIAQRLTTLLAVFPTTIDTNSGNKSASTLRVVLATDQPTLSNAQPVTPAATEVHLGQIGGTTVLAAGTMTRPSDTNGYIAGDGVTTATSSASAMSVTGAARVSAGSGVIFGGRASKSTTGTSAASFRIWLYQGTPTAIPNDNAAFTAAVHADYLTLIGTASFDFANGIVGSDGVEVPITLDRSPMAFKLASGTSLTVIWEARASYSPSSGEIFRLVLDTVQD